MVAIGFRLDESAVGLSRAQLTEKIGSAFSAKKEKLAGMAGALFRFANEMREGDVVIVPDGSTRELLFGVIESDYQFSATPVVGNFRHFRKVHWRGRHERDVLPKRILYSLGAISTIFKPKGQDTLIALMEGKVTTDAAVQETAESDEAEEEDIFADLQSRSEELIRSRFAELDGYEMQDVVAGILRAMGFHTQVSPPGADRGVDIVASRDPLGVEQPIKVQVKARPNTRSGAPEVRELAGVLGQGEKGIFVSSGGFTKEAYTDPGAARITFVDGERLQSLLVEYYDRLDQDVQSLVPLRRLYFPS